MARTAGTTASSPLPSITPPAPVGWEPTQGKTPRHFALDPTANFLYVPNQDSDTIVTFRVNKTTGKLAPTGQIVKVGSPVTIVFAGA
jgi:6-phosphogluconolactonase (cycloisomerase 2 family)